MNEQRGDYDPRPRHPNRPGEPEPLRDLLRQYIEDRNWSDRLTPHATNGHRPNGAASMRHDHG